MSSRTTSAAGLEDGLAIPFLLSRLRGIHALGFQEAFAPARASHSVGSSLRIQKKHRFTYYVILYIILLFINEEIMKTS